MPRVVGTLKPRDLPEFKWVDTVPSSLETMMSGAYKALRYHKYAETDSPPSLTASTSAPTCETSSSTWLEPRQFRKESSEVDMLRQASNHESRSHRCAISRQIESIQTHRYASSSWRCLGSDAFGDRLPPEFDTYGT